MTVEDQGPVSWRPMTVKWRQFSRSNRHSTIDSRQTEYREALPSSTNVQSHLTSFADDGNASWYSVCRVSMVEWRLDCENCRHSTVVGLHDSDPRAVWKQFTSRPGISGAHFPIHLPSHCLVGLVVKASAPRAEDPGFDSRLRREDFFSRIWVSSYQWLKD